MPYTHNLQTHSGLLWTWTWSNKSTYQNVFFGSQKCCALQAEEEEELPDCSSTKVKGQHLWSVICVWGCVCEIIPYCYTLSEISSVSQLSAEKSPNVSFDQSNVRKWKTQDKHLLILLHQLQRLVPCFYVYEADFWLMINVYDLSLNQENNRQIIQQWKWVRVELCIQFFYIHSTVYIHTPLPVTQVKFWLFWQVLFLLFTPETLIKAPQIQYMVMSGHWR